MTVAIAIAAPGVAAAAEEPLIPPGNSAVNQYTESFPTAAGDKDFEKGRKRSPDQVLGKDRAKRLEQRGPDGKAVAEVAAETAPSPSEGSTTGSEAPAAAGAPEGGGPGNGSPATADGQRTGEPGSAASGGGSVQEPDGSSAIGEVLAQATGSTDSGEMGLLLPLVIIAALGGALAFLSRRLRRVEA